MTHARRRHGIAAAAGCRRCWDPAGLGRGREYEPGRLLTIICACCIPGLEAAGWHATRLYGDDDIPDVLCPHLAALVT
jgi:hypothetical protein